MNRTRIATLVAGTALAAFSVGCSETANTNVNARLNSNVAVVTNTNTANMNAANTSGGVYNRNYNTRADYDKDAADYKAEAKNAGSTIGQGLEDGWIHFKTRAALAAVDDLRDSTINVDVDNAVITLRGDVGSAAQKAAAEKAAKGIEGQKGVKNNLAVKAMGTGANTNATNMNATK